MFSLVIRFMHPHNRIQEIFQLESRRVLATLIRYLGDFDLAEDALAEAFAAAAETWPRDGVPANPRAWLVSTGRFKAIDAMRRHSKFSGLQAELVRRNDEVAKANASRAIQAAISAEHARSVSATETNWNEIVDWYDLLSQAAPSSIVELNRAVAIAMRDGPAAGLALVDSILHRGELTDYYLAHSARGELLRRAGNAKAAKDSFERALSLAKQEPERRFLRRKIEQTVLRDSN